MSHRGAVKWRCDLRCVGLSALILGGCEAPPTVPPGADEGALRSADASDPSAPRPTCLRSGEPAPPARAWFVDATARDPALAAALAPVPGVLWRGVAAGDVDGDGDLDLVVARGQDAAGQSASRWLANDGAMRFTLADARLAAGQAVLLADFDNDGDLDLVVGGTEVVVHEALGAGRFGPAVRLTTLSRPALSLNTGDLDGDGRLDLVVGGERELRVLTNVGGIALQDAASRWSLAVVPHGFVHAAMIFDVDEDGATDLFVSMDSDAADDGSGPPPGVTEGDVVMLRRGLRDGRPHFEDHARRLGLLGPRAGMGGTLGDLDGDGDLDLYLSNIGRNHLLLRGADGVFVDATDRFGVGYAQRDPAGCASSTQPRACLHYTWMQQRADFDGDGHDDLAVTAARFSQDPQLPLFVQGDGRGGYQRVSPGVDCFAARTLLAVDLDGDTDPDLVATTALGELLLLRNVTRGAPRRCVALRGVASNREGRGAVVTAVSAAGQRAPKVMAPGGGVLGDGPATVCFGAGVDPPVRFDVRWPSGRRQSADARDGTVVLVEPGDPAPPSEGTP